MITALHQFARIGNVEKAVQFLDRGAAIDAHDEDLCSTPLGWAAKFGQLEMAELLLERGARTNLPDDPPWATPLAWASRRGNPEMVALLQKSRGTLMNRQTNASSRSIMRLIRPRHDALQVFGKRERSCRSPVSSCSLCVLAFLAIGHQSVAAATPADALNRNGRAEFQRNEARRPTGGCQHPTLLVPARSIPHGQSCQRARSSAGRSTGRGDADSGVLDGQV